MTKPSKSAKTDLVRSVIAATKFNDPKEVIAKLITEQATNETERQILACQKYQGNKYQNNRGNKKFEYNSHRNNHKNKSNGYNWNKSYNNKNNYNGRGRSNYNNNNRQNNGNNSSYVRVAENATAPSN